MLYHGITELDNVKSIDFLSSDINIELDIERYQGSKRLYIICKITETELDHTEPVEYSYIAEPPAYPGMQYTLYKEITLNTVDIHPDIIKNCRTYPRGL
jgi:hypothetical protein